MVNIYMYTYITTKLPNEAYQLACFAQPGRWAGPLSARRPANRASSTSQLDQPIVPARPASTASHSCPLDQPTLLAAAGLE